MSEQSDVAAVWSMHGAEGGTAEHAGYRLRVAYYGKSRWTWEVLSLGKLPTTRYAHGHVYFVMDHLEALRRARECAEKKSAQLRKRFKKKSVDPRDIVTYTDEPELAITARPKDEVE